MAYKSPIDPPARPNTAYVMLGAINLSAFASLIVFMVTL